MLPRLRGNKQKKRAVFKISHSSIKGSIFLAQRSAFLCCFSVSAFLRLLTSLSDCGQLFNHMSHRPAMIFVGSYVRAKEELHDYCKHYTRCSAPKPMHEVFLPANVYVCIEKTAPLILYDAWHLQSLKNF